MRCKACDKPLSTMTDKAHGKCHGCRALEVDEQRRHERAVQDARDRIVDAAKAWLGAKQPQEAKSVLVIAVAALEKLEGSR